MCGLYPSSTVDAIELAMYPGDTITQARALFGYLAQHGADRLLNLRNSHWVVEPNFHFSFIRRGLGDNVTTSLSLDGYLRYWMPPRRIEQVSPDESGNFRTALGQFVEAGLMQEKDIPEVCTKALNIGANVLNVNPGLKVVYTWPLTDAISIDRKGGMTDAVRDKANEALAAWGGEVFRVGTAQAQSRGAT
jgi:hypothetical protein